MMGVIMVLYERYIKKKDQQVDPDEEGEVVETGRTSRSRSDNGNRKLRSTQTV